MKNDVKLCNKKRDLFKMLGHSLYVDSEINKTRAVRRQ